MDAEPGEKGNYCRLCSSNNTNSATGVSETAPSLKGNLVFLLYLIIALSDLGDYCGNKSPSVVGIS